jgi:tellurite resistance protein TehA-like permease
MGLATIVSMLAFVAAPLSSGWLVFTQVLFWIDVAISLLTCFGVPLFMYSSYAQFLIERIMCHQQSIDKLTAVWLLPVVAAVVAAATAGNVAAVIPPTSGSFQSTLIIGYVLWGIGVPFSGCILVLYLHRLTIYKVLPQEM